MTEPIATAAYERPTGATLWHEYADCRHGQLHLTQLVACEFEVVETVRL